MEKRFENGFHKYLAMRGYDCIETMHEPGEHLSDGWITAVDDERGRVFMFCAVVDELEDTDNDTTIPARLAYELTAMTWLSDNDLNESRICFDCIEMVVIGCDKGFIRHAHDVW